MQNLFILGALGSMNSEVKMEHLNEFYVLCKTTTQLDQTKDSCFWKGSALNSKRCHLSNLMLAGRVLEGPETGIAVVCLQVRIWDALAMLTWQNISKCFLLLFSPVFTKKRKKKRKKIITQSWNFSLTSLWFNAQQVSWEVTNKISLIDEVLVFCWQCHSIKLPQLTE